MQKSLRITTAIATIALSTFSISTLTACSAQDVAEKVAEQTIKDQTGKDVAVDLNGASLPEGWPTEVPVISGDISQSFHSNANGTESWSFLVKIDDIKADFEEAKAKVEAAGFKSTFDSSTDQGSTSMLENGKLTVTLISSDDGTEKMLAYAVNTN